MKLNLGCGEDYRDGYVNIDKDESVDPDLVHDLNDGLPCGKCEEVLMFHVLEHVDCARSLLEEVNRVMEERAKLIVKVPHRDHFSAVGDPEHKHLFDRCYLKRLVKSCGFEISSCKVTSHPLPESFKEFNKKVAKKHQFSVKNEIILEAYVAG